MIGLNMIGLNMIGFLWHINNSSLHIYIKYMIWLGWVLFYVYSFKCVKINDMP